MGSGTVGWWFTEHRLNSYNMVGLELKALGLGVPFKV